MVLSNIQQINKYLKEIGDIIRLKEDYIDPNSPFNFLDIIDINDETLNVDCIKNGLLSTGPSPTEQEVELNRVKLLLGLQLSDSDTTIGTALGNSSLNSYSTLKKKIIINGNDKDVSEATLFQKILFKNIGNITNGYLYDTFVTTNTFKYYEYLLEALIELYNNPNILGNYIVLNINYKSLSISDKTFATREEEIFPPLNSSLEATKTNGSGLTNVAPNDYSKSTFYKPPTLTTLSQLFEIYVSGNGVDSWGADMSILFNNTIYDNGYHFRGYYNPNNNYLYEGDSTLTSTSGSTTIINSGDWLIIKPIYNIQLTGIIISARNGFIARAPSNWKFFGSNNSGTNWTEIPKASNDKQLNYNDYSNNVYTHNFDAISVNYDYYAIVFNKTIGSGVLNFSGFNLIGYRVNGALMNIAINSTPIGFSDYTIDSNIQLPTNIFTIIREHYKYIKSNTYTNNDTTYNKAAILKLYKLALYNLNNLNNLYYNIPYPYITLNAANYNDTVYKNNETNSIENINPHNIIFGLANGPNSSVYSSSISSVNITNLNVHKYKISNGSETLGGEGRSTSTSTIGDYLGASYKTISGTKIYGTYFSYKHTSKIIINKLDVKALGWTRFNAPYEVKIYATDDNGTSYTAFADTNTTNNLANITNSDTFYQASNNYTKSVEFNSTGTPYFEYLFIFTKTGGDTYPTANDWWDIAWKGHIIINEMKLYTSYGSEIGNTTELFKEFNDIDLYYTPANEYKNLEINNKNQIDVEDSISKLSKRNTKYKNMNNLDKDKIVNITYLEIYCIVILAFIFITGTVLLMNNSMDVSSTYITSIFILMVAVISFYIIITNNLINKNIYENFGGEDDEEDMTTIRNYNKQFLFKAFDNILRGLTLNRYIYIAKYRFYKNHRDKKNDLKRLEIEFSRNKNNTNNTQIEYYKKKNIILFITFLTLLIAVSIFLCIVLPSIKLYILIISIIIFFLLICYLYYSIISVSNNDYSKNYNNLLTSKIYKL